VYRAEGGSYHPSPGTSALKNETKFVWEEKSENKKNEMDGKKCFRRINMQMKFKMECRPWSLGMAQRWLREENGQQMMQP
jgi:hypothetical protein